MDKTQQSQQSKDQLENLENSSAEEVITYAVERFHPSLYLACSFQKEESVLIDMLLKKAPDARIFALDTGVLFPETYELWKQIEAHYGIEIETFQGLSLARQASKHGEALWERDQSACCGIRKIVPLRQALASVDAWITGIRREQSPTRADAQKFEWDAPHNLYKFNPLADWDDKQIWRYIHEHGLPYNPLHDQNYASIGCTHCTKPGEGREGRWAGTDKTECGLHVEGS